MWIEIPTSKENLSREIIDHLDNNSKKNLKNQQFSS